MGRIYVCYVSGFRLFLSGRRGFCSCCVFLNMGSRVERGFGFFFCVYWVCCSGLVVFLVVCLRIDVRGRYFFGKVY